MPAFHYKTEYFFDRPAVQAMIKAASKDGNALARAGAMVRTIARGMIRRRKRATTVSPPGSPPFSKDPAGRYKRIEYIWDEKLQGVKVGHVSYPNRAGPYTPDVHEFGKTTSIPRLIVPRKKLSGLSKAGQKRRLRAFRKLLKRLKEGDTNLSPQAMAWFNRRRRKAKVRFESVTYPRRPVMGPALARARERLPSLWENSLDRSRGGVTALLRSMGGLSGGGGDS